MVNMELLVDFPLHDGAIQDAGPRVTFASQIDITLIENLTFKHKNDLWYTDAEMVSFKRQTALLLRDLQVMNMTLAKYAEENIQDTSEFVGLEAYFSQDSMQKIGLQRTLMKRIVLSEQERQDRADVEDPESLARVSQQVSEWSRVRARIIGLIHASNGDR